MISCTMRPLHSRSCTVKPDAIYNFVEIVHPRLLVGSFCSKTITIIFASDDDDDDD